MIHPDLHLTLVMVYRSEEFNPIVRMHDMLPDSGRCRRCPLSGLTQCRVFTPCLSPVEIPRRSNIEFCADYAHARRTGAVLMHSPELPQFSSVQLEAVPWTILEMNQFHGAWTVINCTVP